MKLYYEDKMPDDNHMDRYYLVGKKRSLLMIARSGIIRDNNEFGLGLVTCVDFPIFITVMFGKSTFNIALFSNNNFINDPDEDDENKDDFVHYY